MGIIADILKGIPLNSVLQEKITEMDRAVDSLTKENATLKAENSKLLKEISQLTHQLQKEDVTAKDFKDIRGLKIRKFPTGGYDESVAYCSHCLSPLSASNRLKPLVCSKCGYQTSIKAMHLSIIIDELKGAPLPAWWRG